MRFMSPKIARWRARASAPARWPVGRLLGGGYATALVALALIGIVAYDQIGALLTARRAVAHTYRVLAKLDRVTMLLEDAERGQRGYLITGEDAYLQPYLRAAGQILGEIDDVARMTRD